MAGGFCNELKEIGRSSCQTRLEAALMDEEREVDGRYCFPAESQAANNKKHEENEADVPEVW